MKVQQHNCSHCALHSNEPTEVPFKAGKIISPWSWKLFICENVHRQLCLSSAPSTILTGAIFSKRIEEKFPSRCSLVVPFSKEN